MMIQTRCIACGATLIATQVAAQTFTPLPTSLLRTELTTLSADGRWAGGVVLSSGKLIRLDTASDQIETFSPPGVFLGFRATGISADGNTIVGGNGSTAFRFDHAPPGPGFSSVTGTGGIAIQNFQPTISDDASTVGFAQVTINPLLTSAVINRGIGNASLLPVPSNTIFSRTSILSPDGSIAYGPVKLDDGQDQWLAKWSIDQNSFELLAQIPGTADDSDFLISGATPDGSTIVGETFGPDGFGFRFSPDTGIFAYTAPTAQRLRPRAITDDGSTIVGTQRLAPNVFQAVIADETGFQPLMDMLLSDYPSLATDLAGWTLTEAADISGDGLTIVGRGIDPSGQDRGWYLTIPSPMTAPVLLLGLAARNRRAHGKQQFNS